MSKPFRSNRYFVSVKRLLPFFGIHTGQIRRKSWQPHG